MQIFLLAALSLVPVPPVAQEEPTPSPPSRSAAARLVAEGDLEAARAELARIVAASPDDGVSWLQLARLEHRAERRAEALRAYEMASDTPGVAGDALYNAACLHALAGRAEEALAALGEAVERGFARRALLESDPELAALRADPRLGELVERLGPAPRADPRATVGFLEDEAEVLWVFEADSGLDRFGWQTEAVGDTNGDGIADVLAGGPFSSDGAPEGGKAWLISGADGSLIRRHTGEEAGGQLGYRCKPAGDVDGDGAADYVLSAPGGNSKDGSVPAGTLGLGYPGSVFVHSGADGELLLRLDAAGDSDRYGFDVASIDLDGDGRPELLVGAPGDDSAAEDAGRVDVVSSRDGEVLRVHAGTLAGERIGSAIGALGDVDGDEVPDYVLGAPGAGLGAGGACYVHSGASGKRLHVLDPARDEPRARVLEFGRFFASSAGDLDGDGFDDVYVADSFDQSAAFASGRVYLYSGKSGRLLFSVAGTATNDWYGIGRGLQEDWNGDGVPDLVVAALASDDGAPNGGRVDVLSGRDGARLASYTSTTPMLCLGFDAHPIGDVDGDGRGDLFLAGSWGPWHPELRGRGVAVRGRELAPADEGGASDGESRDG